MGHWLLLLCCHRAADDRLAMLSRLASFLARRSSRGGSQTWKSRLACRRSFAFAALAAVRRACAGRRGARTACAAHDTRVFSVFLACLSVETRHRKPRCARKWALRAACRPGRKKLKKIVITMEVRFPNSMHTHNPTYGQPYVVMQLSHTAPPPLAAHI